MRRFHVELTYSGSSADSCMYRTRDAIWSADGLETDGSVCAAVLPSGDILVQTTVLLDGSMHDGWDVLDRIRSRIAPGQRPHSEAVSDVDDCGVP